MKKHLFGFALFSLIVGAALIFAAKQEMIEDMPAVTVTPVTYDVTSRSCWKNARQISKDSRTTVKITQAVLNEKSKKLNLNFFVQRETPAMQDVSVKLTFVNGEFGDNGLREGVVDTSYVTFSPNFNTDNQATYTLPYRWSNDLATNDNLYVLAELADGVSNNSNQISRKTNYSNYTPVLLSGKK